MKAAGLVILVMVTARLAAARYLIVNRAHLAHNLLKLEILQRLTNSKLRGNGLNI